MNSFGVPDVDIVCRGDVIESLKIKKGLDERPIWKAMEQVEPKFMLSWASRLDSLCSGAAEWSLVQAIEASWGGVIERRTQIERSIYCELNRLVWLTSYLGKVLNELGNRNLVESVYFLRELVFNMQEELTGGRILLQVYTPGGVRRNLAIGDNQKILSFLENFKTVWTNWCDLTLFDPVIEMRLSGILKIPESKLRQLSWWGIGGKAGDYFYDSRIHRPHGAYVEIDFKIPTHSEGDGWARFNQVVGELHLALELLEKFVRTIPPAKGKANLPEVKLRPGIWSGCAESAKGPIISVLEVNEECSVVGAKMFTTSQRVWPRIEEFFSDPQRPTRVEDYRLGIVSLGIDAEDGET